MKNPAYHGMGVAVITPFKKDKSVDFEALEQLINDLIANGADYLVALGTTSEAATMSSDEKKEIIKLFKNLCHSKVPLVVGIGGNHTAEIVQQIKHFDFIGVSGILSVTPYYNKPNQRGLLAHFKEIAEVSPVDVILYNVPGRTGINMQAETTLQLTHDCRNIVAIKEASGNLDQIMQICKDKPHHFSVISGDDAYVPAQIALGMSGVISVAGNVLTRKFSDMVHACLEGDYAKAMPLHYSMLDFYNYLFAEGNPAGAKAAMYLQGRIENELRLPLVPVSDRLFEKMEEQIDLLY